MKGHFSPIGGKIQYSILSLSNITFLERNKIYLRNIKNTDLADEILFAKRQIWARNVFFHKKRE